MWMIGTPAEWIGLHLCIVWLCKTWRDSFRIVIRSKWLDCKQKPHQPFNAMHCIALQWHRCGSCSFRYVRMLSFVIPFVFGIQTLCESVGLHLAVVVSYRMFSHLFTFTFVITLNMRASLLSFVLAKFCMTFEIIEYKVIKNRHIECIECAIQS